MMTAAEARQLTVDSTEQRAKEFIVNYVGDMIRNAANCGNFLTQVPMIGANPVALGAKVVELLEEQGYQATHVYIGEDNYIEIDWEGDRT